MKAVNKENSIVKGYIFMAIENTKIQSITNDLIKIGDLPLNKIEAVAGGINNKKFNEFSIIADLYIWTNKYWYGTYCENLTLLRLKDVEDVPIFFSIKYGDKLRLAIKTKFAYIVKNEDRELLKMTNRKSLRNFNDERIRDISPGMEKLETKWDLLISNRNPYQSRI